MRPRIDVLLLLLSVSLCLPVSLPAAEPQMEKAFIFGNYNIVCPTFNAPTTNYTVVWHQADSVAAHDALAYQAARGWGYEVLYDKFTVNNATPYGDRTGGEQFGPFDDTPNNRNLLGDTCPAQIYDSFIGGKNFLTPCTSAIDSSVDPNIPCDQGDLGDGIPEGLIFRVDVPNGKYRFVAAVGSVDNAHASRILAEDGGSGPPEAIGDNKVVLVSNFDQSNYPQRTFARVGFGCYIPPPAPQVAFADMDAEGLVTEESPDSPILEVTQGYIRIHQLQANSNQGTVRAGDPNGGNMVILEIWNVGDQVIPPGVFGTASRTIDPDIHAPGGTVTITLSVTGVVGAASVVETLPGGYTVQDAGGGTVAGNTITFNFTADGTRTYVLKAPSDACASANITGVLDGGCTGGVAGETLVACEGALSPTGAVLTQLIIGPIDLAGNAGTSCDDNGNLATGDYLSDGATTEASILVQDGDEITPDFGGASAGVGVEMTGANTAINPNGAAGILQVWTANADANGLINYNLAQNIGETGTAAEDPPADYIVYSMVYLQNLAATCRNVILEVGSDDAAKIRLNGDVIHLAATCRGVAAYGAGDRIAASLLPGKNVLLIGVVERGGGNSVRLVLRNTDDTPLTDGGVVVSLAPPATMPSAGLKVTRAIDPDLHAPGDTITVTLDIQEVKGAVTITETFPAGYTVTDAGGGTVAGNTIAFAVAASQTRTYTLKAPADSCECGLPITGQIAGTGTCAGVMGEALVSCQWPAPVCEPAQSAELVWAFAFGTHAAFAGTPGEWCLTYNDPAVMYTPVDHIDAATDATAPAQIQYDSGRGWGYEAVHDAANLPYGERNGFGIFGAFDDSPNARNKYPDTCPEELYDSFIGAKDWLDNQVIGGQVIADGQDSCSATTVGNPDDPCSTVKPPEGIIFRVDVPNGKYRFVAAVGDDDNVHAHRILAEDGGEGPPAQIGARHVVLVSNFDQAQFTGGEADAAEPGEGVFARVGFDGRIPPPGDDVPPSPTFVNMDESGMPTAECARSPTLEVTQGYVRIHQLQGNSNDGCGGPRDPNGGDLVLLEIWQVDTGPQKPVFLRGDPNDDGAVNITDGIYVLNFLFLGGPKPTCQESADPNDDGTVNITDGIYILNYLFLGGPQPVAPGPAGKGLPCGQDRPGSPSDLGCASYTKC